VKRSERRVHRGNRRVPGSDAATTIRIAQWGTGTVGRHALDAVLASPEFELVACYVTSEAKVGRDVGHLLGREPVGLVAVGTLAEVVAARPDCVLHMPLPSAQVGDDPGYDTDVLCQLLAAGIDVITTVGYLYPKAYGPEVFGRLETACAAGGSSLHGTGLNPGFMSELVPLVLSGLCTQISSVLVVESSEFSRYPSPEVIFGMMGFGQAPERYATHSERYHRWLTGLFSESVMMVADGLGVALDSIDVHHESVVTTDELVIAAGIVPAGTVAAQRWHWHGMSGGQPVVRLEAIFKAHPSVAPEWSSPAWVCRIDGRPKVNIELDRWLSNGLLATAMHAVHAIGPVHAAAPGVRTFLDLPLVVGRGTVTPR
jgi:4-hydroxy-tetrahydrodipicolinate reductase